MIAFGGSCLKASIFDHKKLRAWLAVLAVVLVAGCSDDNTNSGNGPEVDGVVSISTIIVNPRMAEPGDTIVVTAALEGVATPGQFATVQWTASGGEFITDKGESVDWIAPKDTSAVFRLSCRATSGQSTDDGFVDVFVGEPKLSVNQNAGEIQLRPAPGEFYYLNSIPFEEEWDSSRVYIQTTGVPEAVVSGVRVGAHFAFSSALSNAAYVANTAGLKQFTTDPLDIFVVDLNGRSERKITSDRAAPTSGRRYQFKRPYFSPDENWITYQGFQPSPQSGNIDTTDVFVYNLQTDEETNVTEVDVTSNQRNNLFPSYSTDSKWLVFISDKGQSQHWDFFGNKLGSGGGIADATQQLTTDGLVGVTSLSSLGTPKLEWNPVQPLLAVVGGGGSDGGLHLVTMTDNGANASDVADVGFNLVEIAWSGNGQVLAVSSIVDAASGEGVENVIFTVTPGGSVMRRHAASVDDRIVDMGWSADGKFLVYRLVRRGRSWFELIDIDGGTNYAAPLAITKSASDGKRTTYSPEMSVAARYGTGETVYFALFDLGITAQGTPTIWTLDVSAAVQP
jgi:Tol biopolymer transport system component